MHLHDLFTVAVVILTTGWRFHACWNTASTWYTFVEFDRGLYCTISHKKRSQTCVKWKWRSVKTVAPRHLKYSYIDQLSPSTVFTVFLYSMANSSRKSARELEVFLCKKINILSVFYADVLLFFRLNYL